MFAQDSRPVSNAGAAFGYQVVLDLPSTRSPSLLYQLTRGSETTSSTQLTPS